MRTLYSGRFEGETSEAIRKLNDSFPFDWRLWREDIECSIAHATMLAQTGIIDGLEAEAIVRSLNQILAGWESGEEKFPEGAEDIHTAVELALTDRIGDTARKLHTARSRNDQVATDFRLYVMRAIQRTEEQIRAFQQVLLSTAEAQIDVIMPGYTHLQHAQPIRLSHHLLAFFWMLQRDIARLQDAARRADELPLGSAALAGTSFPIDRKMIAGQLGFSRVSQNSIDAVSDRDFVLEALAALSILSVHLSRFGEELILWNSREFGFIELSDAVATGSSIMPQKKNPDVAELARGKTGRVIGHLMALLITMKGLPLAYNKDMQEDKEGFFDAFDTIFLLLPALAETLQTAKFNQSRMAEACEGDFSMSTDLADALAAAGVPFRDAHEMVAGLVRQCLAMGTTLEDLTREELAVVHPVLATAILTPEASVERRKSFGGTSKQAVLDQLRAGRASLGMP